MTQEEKQLLLVDLCGRLLYGVKVRIGNDDAKTSLTETVDVIGKNIDSENAINGWSIDKINIKPYLRPLSSMTEEEYIKYRTMQGRNCDYGEATICVSKSLFSRILFDDNGLVKINIYYPNPIIQDWLNKKMFDYRGLIPMGLALSAPEGMYDI